MTSYRRAEDAEEVSDSVFVCTCDDFIETRDKVDGGNRWDGVKSVILLMCEWPQLDEAEGILTVH